MSLVDKPFKEALRELPTKKLSWWADRRIRKMLRHRAMELDGRTDWAGFFKQLVAVPMSLVLLLTTVGGYAYASPTVVKGDLLYSVKTTLERARYPLDGTSEDRIAYHLWLSERRYEEVNELLDRLGKPPVVFIPVARAADVSAGSELELYLVETLENATRQVDYAFLISDEIRDVERVKVVHEQIRGSVEKQKEFLKKVTPVLKDVKLQTKKKPRLKRMKSETVPAQEISMTSENTVETDTSTTVEPETPEATESTLSVESDPNETEPGAETPEQQPLIPEQRVEEETSLEAIDDLLEDRLSFQEALLAHIDETILQAGVKGEAVVVLRISVPLHPLEEDLEVSDDLFRQALTVHYRNSQHLLTTDLKELDKKLIAESEHPEVLPPESSPEADVDVQASSETALQLESSPAPESEPTNETSEKVPEVLPPPVVPEVTPKVPEPTPAPTETVVPAECAKKVEELCSGTDEQQKCSEKAVKECQEAIRAENERKEQELLKQELREKAEKVKRELQDVEMRIEQLHLNTDIDVPEVSTEIQGSILRDSRKDPDTKRKSVEERR